MLGNTPAATITVSTLSSHNLISGSDALQAALIVICAVALLASLWGLVQRFKRRSLRKSNAVLFVVAAVSAVGLIGAFALPFFQQDIPDYHTQSPTDKTEALYEIDDGFFTFDGNKQFNLDAQGSIDKTIELPITAHGTYDGTVTVTTKTQTLNAPDGSSLRVEPVDESLVFTSADFAESTTKTLHVHITGESLIGNQWSGPVGFSFSTQDLFPKGTDGWYTPDNGSTFYFIRDNRTVRGWLEQTEAPDGTAAELQRFWLDENTGALARNKVIATSNTTYSYAQDNGAILRSNAFNDGKGNVFIADDNGDLVWNDKTGWMEADFGDGNQTYYINRESHGANVGFFTVDEKKYFGTEDGFILHGTANWNNYLVFTDDDGLLLEDNGWVELERGKSRFFDIAYTNENGTTYRAVRTGIFEVDGMRYYGDTENGFIAMNKAVHFEGKTYYADENGSTTELSDWSLEKADWAHDKSDAVGIAEDEQYLESCRDRAIATGSSTDYYITIDNRWEGGGRVIVFHREHGCWVALAGWYSNVGRWTGSGGNTGTRSIPGVHVITHRIAQGTVDNGELAPWTIPWFVCYVDYWFDEPHTDINDDGQGFHYTPNPNEQGNDMSGCAAFTTEWRAKWIYDNVPDGTSVDVYGAAHGVGFD